LSPAALTGSVSAASSGWHLLRCLRRTSLKRPTEAVGTGKKDRSALSNHTFVQTSLDSRHRQRDVLKYAFSHRGHIRAVELGLQGLQADSLCVDDWLHVAHTKVGLSTLSPSSILDDMEITIEFKPIE